MSHRGLAHLGVYLFLSIYTQSDYYLLTYIDILSVWVLVGFIFLGISFSSTFSNVRYKVYIIFQFFNVFKNYWNPHFLYLYCYLSPCPFSLNYAYRGFINLINNKIGILLPYIFGGIFWWSHLGLQILIK